MYVEYVTFEGTKVPSYVRVHTRTQLHISYTHGLKEKILNGHSEPQPTSRACTVAMGAVTYYGNGKWHLPRMCDRASR